MEFLDPVSRKKKSRRLFIGYGLVTILVCLATYILVATAVGFEIFKTNGDVVQNGLLFLDTKPVSAQVFINNAEERDTTSSKLALKSGDYDVKLKADGYIDWTKRINVTGGQVRFATYPRLYPAIITAKELKPLPATTGMVSQSPDHQWLIIQPNVSLPSIDIHDLSIATAQSASVVIPPTLLLSKDGSYGTFELIEWADDNRHMLVEQKLTDGRHAFLLIDREAIDSSINLGVTFASEPTTVSLRNQKADRFYFYFGAGGLLRGADLKTKILSEPLLDQVLSFKSINSDLIEYITPKDAEAGTVAAKIFTGNRSYDLAKVIFDPESRYFLDANQFDGDWYYMVGSHQSDKVQIYRNPLNFSAAKEPKKPAVLATLRAGVPDFGGFSDNKRFMLSQSRQEVAVYDAEEKTSYRYELAHDIDQGSKVSWIDGHRFQYVSGGRLYVSEFDGQNNHDLASVKGVQKGYFNDSQEFLYTISPSGEAGTALESSYMLVSK